jgi:uncharacterized protein YPO0396
MMMKQLQTKIGSRNRRLQENKEEIIAEMHKIIKELGPNNRSSTPKLDELHDKLIKETA